MAQKYSFRDPVTNRLKAWGYITHNEPGDVQQVEADEFTLDLTTRAWVWDGLQWVEIPFPVLPPSPLATAIQAAITTTTLATLKTVLQEWKKQVR